MSSELKLGAKPAETRKGQPDLSGHKMFARIAPPRMIRSNVNFSPLLLANNVLGNCTSAGIGNTIRAVSALGGFQTNISDENAVSFYSQSTGYSPNVPGSDDGGVEVDVLANAARQGYPVENERLYPLWGSLDPQDQNGIRCVAQAFGTTYLGVKLAIADQANVGAVWDTNTPAEDGDPTPGSWGGHCLLAGAEWYGTQDTDIVLLTTWGTQQRATWRWVRSRIMEAHALAFRQLMPASGHFWTGDDWERLEADNAAYLSGVAN